LRQCLGSLGSRRLWCDYIIRNESKHSKRNAIEKFLNTHTFGTPLAHLTKWIEQKPRLNQNQKAFKTEGNDNEGINE